MILEQIGEFVIRVEHGDESSWHAVDRLTGENDAWSGLPVAQTLFVGQVWQDTAHELKHWEGLDDSEALARAEAESLKSAHSFIYNHRAYQPASRRAACVARKKN